MNTNSTFYALDTTTNLWELVRTKSFQNDPMNTPPAIDEHTAVVNEDYMYVFGGFVDGDRVNFTYKFTLSFTLKYFVLLYKKVISFLYFMEAS